jgi:DNA-binding LacI/PurR family transcriptional regulator
MRNPSPTLKDVAHAAGVSPFTVSVVLNGSRSNTRVSEATQRRIVETAERMRYRPNAMARGLARQRTGAIGILFSVVQSTVALSNAYASEIAQGIVTQAAARGYDVMLYTEPWRDAAHSARRYLDRRTDGILLIAPLTDSDILEGMASLGIPLVVVSADPDETKRWSHVTNVDVDNAAGIRLAVTHLRELGHQRIVHLTGDANVASVALRIAAFHEATADIAAHCSVVGATYDGNAVATVLPEILAATNPPTAIVAGNDQIAIEVMASARALGVTVPQQLSVVGFDDIRAASQVTPALTTIRQPMHEIGSTACDCLLNRLAETADGTEIAAIPPEILLAPERVLRDSTGPVLVKE